MISFIVVIYRHEVGSSDLLAEQSYCHELKWELALFIFQLELNMDLAALGGFVEVWVGNSFLHFEQELRRIRFFSNIELKLLNCDLSSKSEFPVEDYLLRLAKGKLNLVVS